MAPRCSAAAAAQLLLRWNCCGCWRGLKQRVHAVVTNPFFDLGIVVCIIIDVLFMAMEHYPLTVEFEQTLACAHLVGERGRPARTRSRRSSLLPLFSLHSQVFTAIYTVEMVVKIVALDPYGYFKVRIRAGPPITP